VDNRAYQEAVSSSLGSVGAQEWHLTQPSQPGFRCERGWAKCINSVNIQYCGCHPYSNGG